MLADVLVSDIPHSSLAKDLPAISSPRKPDIDHSVTNSILALFELAALRTPDPELVRHIRQVIATKRSTLSRSQLTSTTILDTHAGFDQEKARTYKVPPRARNRAYKRFLRLSVSQDFTEPQMEYTEASAIKKSRGLRTLAQTASASKYFAFP